MGKKEELIDLLLQLEDSAEAGIAISFVEDVPPEDIRFQLQFRGGKPALAYWLEQKKKSAGVSSLSQEALVAVATAAATAAAKDAVAPIRQLLNIVLLGDTKPTAPSSSKAEKEYRRDAIQFYYGSTQPEKLMCMVTGEELDPSCIRAGHVYRQAWNKPLMRYMDGMAVNDPRNIVLMRKQVEEKFDLFEITIIPQTEEDVYKVVVLRQDLLQQYIGTGDKTKGDTMTWNDVNNQNLHVQHLQPGSRPARRVLAMHATLAISWAEQHPWGIDKGAVQVPEAGWSSPGYDRGLMASFLSALEPAEQSDGGAAE